MGRSKCVCSGRKECNETCAEYKAHSQVAVNGAGSHVRAPS